MKQRALKRSADKLRSARDIGMTTRPSQDRLLQTGVQTYQHHRPGNAVTVACKKCIAIRNSWRVKRCMCRKLESEETKDLASPLTSL